MHEALENEKVTVSDVPSAITSPDASPSNVATVTSARSVKLLGVEAVLAVWWAPKITVSPGAVAYDKATLVLVPTATFDSPSYLVVTGLQYWYADAMTALWVLASPA